MDLLTKLAKRTFNKQPFLREWDFFIVITLIAKVLTMVFSIFAGYFYFVDLFSSALNNNATLAKAFSILCLLIIELSTAIAITKFFKFAIKKKVNLAIFSLMIAVITFSISFISSTNGLALRQSNTVDNSLQIENSYIQVVKDTKQEYNSKVADLNSLIEIEKQNPQGWKGKERSTLTASQLKRIENYRITINSLNDELNARLGKIESAKNKELENNEKLTGAESDKFYNIVAGIMILVFLINGLLVYFYSEIARADPETELEREVREQADAVIRRVYSERFRTYSAVRVDEVKPDEVRSCKQCNAEFVPKHWNQRYCNDKCKNLYNERRNN
jgi:hypothetical protein